MKIGGERKVFSLSGPPPRTFSAKRWAKRALVGLFEPYQEALPLESGYYSFVLDARGRFRVERGNTRSHAGMVGGEDVGAAGNFRITRSGKVGEVTCTSRDYQFRIQDERSPTVAFVIDAFRRHQAFDVSPHAIFAFARGFLTPRLGVSVEGLPIVDDEARRRLLDQEGQGLAPDVGFLARQVEAFRGYVPPTPPRLYPMKLDQWEEPLDFDAPADQAFEVGPSRPPYSPQDGPIGAGRKAFILDDAGYLVLGFGHHLLSGGREVGAAGQFHVDDTGAIVEVSLNFSGHYRPPLSAEYARYTYRTLIGHPLLSFAPDCRVTARKTFDLATSLETIVFDRDELISDDPRLDLEIENLEIRSAFDSDFLPEGEDDEA